MFTSKDSCCYNRPYDDQRQLRIELETKAKLFIQDLIVSGRLLLTISSVSILENNKNPYDDQRASIRDFFKYASQTATTSEQTFASAKKLRKQGLKTYDAIHLAFAIAAGCDYFVTTDDRLLRHRDSRIVIIGPQDFLKVWEVYESDD
jgi:predicted nucleic acid-binding protein